MALRACPPGCPLLAWDALSPSQEMSPFLDRLWVLTPEHLQEALMGPGAASSWGLLCTQTVKTRMCEKYTCFLFFLKVVGGKLWGGVWISPDIGACCHSNHASGPWGCRRSPQAGLGWGWERAAGDSASGWGAGLHVAPRQVFERSGVKPPGAGGPGSGTLRSVLMNGRRPSGGLPLRGRCCALHPAARGPSPAFCPLLSKSHGAGP